MYPESDIEDEDDEEEEPEDTGPNHATRVNVVFDHG
jgi:hypothetical protein